MLEEGLVVFLMCVCCCTVVFEQKWDGFGASVGVFASSSYDEVVEGLVEFSVLMCAEMCDCGV